MKIVIAGGSGMIGSHLVKRWKSVGHQVAVLTRHGHPGFDVEQVMWDGKHAGKWAESLEACDALINLSGKSYYCRHNKQTRLELINSRIDSTEALEEAIQGLETPPKVWINASTAMIYRYSEDRPMNEDTGDFGIGFLCDLGRSWEAALFEKPLPKTRRVAARLSYVMCADRRSIFENFHRFVRKGFGGALGTGNQFVSWVHIDDVARAFEWIIEQPELNGPVNISSPKPQHNRDFMRTLREANETKIGVNLPGLLATLGAIRQKIEDEFVLKSRWVTPQKLLDSGFQFDYPAWDRAARNILTKRKDQT